MLPAFHSIQHMNMNKIIPMIATLSLGISLLGSCAFTEKIIPVPRTIEPGPRPKR